VKRIFGEQLGVMWRLISLEEETFGELVDGPCKIVV
jgi:hypothetical protein